MEIQKINNSPSFQAIKLTTKEGRKVADIIRSYQNNPSPLLKEQLVDVFTPHIEKEASLYEGINKNDFMQELYLCLLENIDKVNTKHHPSASLVNKLNEVPHTDSMPTMGHKLLEEVTDTDLEKLAQTESEFMHDLNIGEYMFDSKEIIKQTHLTPREQDILIAKLDEKSDKEIGDALHLTKCRVQQIANKSARKLSYEYTFNKLIQTEDFDALDHIQPKVKKKYIHNSRLTTLL